MHNPPATLLPRAFFDRSPETVARDLLGKRIERRYEGEVLAGRITEVEAYLGEDDPASHTFIGRTARNAVLFGPPGFAYVYFIYGMHFCLNASCLPDGVPGGVLFRAFTPLRGLDTMRRLRGLPASAAPQQIAGGPGRLCQALGITRQNSNGLDFTATDSPLQLVDDGFIAEQVEVTPRIGLHAAADKPLRFLLQIPGLQDPLRKKRRRDLD